jgi:hypothetical protein
MNDHTGLPDATVGLPDGLIAAARDEALRRLARRGGLTPFAMRAADSVLDGDGQTNRDQLDDLYRRLAALPPAAVVVISEGSSDSHKNLLIIYAETSDGQACRVIDAISFSKNPLFFGPILLRRGEASLSPVESTTLPPRIQTARTNTVAAEN